jgi:DNA-binding Lrp family transcriptional regulator
MEKTKITKAMVLEVIRAAAENGSISGEVTVNDKVIAITGEDVINYVDKTVEQLNAKAAKAKERAAEKRAEGDALRNAVQAVLTDAPQTIDDIAGQVEVENVEITKAKVTARLTQLIKAGIATKEQAKVGDRKVMTYKLVGSED